MFFGSLSFCSEEPQFLTDDFNERGPWRRHNGCPCRLLASSTISSVLVKTSSLAFRVDVPHSVLLCHHHGPGTPFAILPEAAPVHLPGKLCIWSGPLIWILSQPVLGSGFLHNHVVECPRQGVGTQSSSLHSESVCVWGGGLRRRLL